jgi:hypothetical protein
LKQWQHQVAPGDGLRARMERGAWAAAGQREPWRWYPARALRSLVLYVAMAAALVLLGGLPATGLVGGFAGYAWMVAWAHRLHLRHLAAQDPARRAPGRLTRPQVAVLALSLVILPGAVVLAVRDTDSREEAVGRALGADKLSRGDEARLRGFFDAARPFRVHYEKLVRTLNAGESTVADAEAALEPVDATVRRMQGASRGFDDADIEAALVGYVKPLADIVAVVERGLTLDEDDEEAIAAYTEDAERASRAARRADEEFLSRLTAELPPDEAAQVREDYRRRVKEFEKLKDGG